MFVETPRLPVGNDPHFEKRRDVEPVPKVLHRDDPVIRTRVEWNRRYTQWGTWILSVSRSLNSRRVTFYLVPSQGQPLVSRLCEALAGTRRGAASFPYIGIASRLFFGHRIRDDKHNQNFQTYVPEGTLPWKLRCLLESCWLRRSGCFGRSKEA